MNEDHVKINFRLERDSDDYPPVDVESVWAIPLGSGTYRIDNIPFYVRGISTDDVVSAMDDRGSLYYDSIVSTGGHTTVRVLMANPAETDAIRGELRMRGCVSELTNIAGLIAVDVPPSVSYAEVREYLAEGEDAGRWEFEEGCVAHPV